MMQKIWIITNREWKERLKSKTFISTAILGPLVVLSLVYLLFTLSGNNKQKWSILIVDPAGIMENKILAKEDAYLSYSFVNSYVEVDEFIKGKNFKQFDAMLEVNEKILENKVAYLFYKQKPTSNFIYLIQYQFERRIEEVLVKQFTDLSIAKFRSLKQPIQLATKNAYDPENKQSDLSAWVGYFFGSIILFFTFLFGMTILRSISVEKSNRIVEVLLSSVKPQELLMGKILGVGFAALLQFICWTFIIGLGLFIMRSTLFPDMMDAANLSASQFNEQMQQLSFQENYFRSVQYNEFVDLVFERIQFGSMLFYFVIIFILCYLFYSSFFTGLGALTGSESDGQQFVIPILILMSLAMYSGYFVVNNPTHPLTTFFSYFPFTSPVVLMVQIAQGYEAGQVYQLYLSMLVLLISYLIVLRIASRWFKNGILQFGHRLKLSHFIKWL